MRPRMEPEGFKGKYPRAFFWLRIAYFIVIGLLIAEIGARVSTYLVFRSGLSEFPDIERRYEQSRVHYPKMTVGVVTGEPAQWLAVIPSQDGPPRIEPFGSIPEDGFVQPLPTEPPGPSIVRIAFVGGSTTYDGYPERVRERLQKQFGSERIEVVNLGIPASNSATSLLMMRRFLPQIRPQIVVVYHGFNDVVYWRARIAALDRLERGVAGPEDPAIEVMPASRGLFSLLRGRATEQPLAGASLDAIAENYEAMAALGTELHFSLWVSTFAAPSYAELDADELRYFDAELRYLWPVLGTVDRYAQDLASYHELLRDIAPQFELGLIDVAAEVRGGRASFADNCHLTEAGRELHADAVAAALAPAVKALLDSGR
jgi:lysophospholipase L1-like esterase